MKFHIVVVFMVSFFNLCSNGENNTAYTRGLFREVFYNMAVNINNLRSSLVYPKVSSYCNIITLFDASISAANYCQRVRGWFVTPLKGNHTFYTSCDDICEFYLSDDNDPSNIHLLISQTIWSAHNQWNKYPTMQSSSPIPLKANYSYYIEMVMFNSGTPDGFSLAVRLPNNTFLGPIRNDLMSFLKTCTLNSCTSSKIEKCVSVNTSFGICNCQIGYYALNSTCQDIDECSALTYNCFPNSRCINNDGSYYCACNTFWKLADDSQSCVDINECIDGTHNCYGDKIHCTNTIGGYNCSCDNECWVLRSDIQGKRCEERMTKDCKPYLNVNFTGSFDGKLLALHLEMHHLNDSLVYAHNVMFEYFLPSYIALSSESINQGFTGLKQSKLKYILTGAFTFNSSIIHSINSTTLTTSCSAQVFTILIPLKVTFQNLEGRTWVLYKKYQNKISFSCSKSPKIAKDANALPESYGRGIYWDETNSLVYVCMNQHVISTETACYRSNDDGQIWTDLDVRLGSVLGHHLLTNELYAIHRNQKTYLVFRKDSQQWFSLTNEQFFKNVSRYINYNAWQNLEGDEDQTFTLGSKQWMGNVDGLFFWNTGNGTWLQRVNWC